MDPYTNVPKGAELFTVFSVRTGGPHCRPHFAPKGLNKPPIEGTYSVEEQMSIRTAVAPLFIGLSHRVSAREIAPSSSLEDQITALFDRFHGPLFRYLSALRLNSADIEEIIQEVFLALFRRLKDGGRVESTAGWIFGAAHNLGLRQSIRSRRMCEAECGADACEIADRAPNPEDLYARHELSERLLAVVRSLPEMDRYCILLRAEGLRYREIAATLGISLGAVALSLSRSLARIARCVERCNR